MRSNPIATSEITRNDGVATPVSAANAPGESRHPESGVDRDVPRRQPGHHLNQGEHVGEFPVTEPVVFPDKHLLRHQQNSEAAAYHEEGNLEELPEEHPAEFPPGGGGKRRLRRLNRCFHLSVSIKKNSGRLRCAAGIRRG
ncbi:MAG: hypothetical protein L6W00_27680 [Lentisphaeria bacterium]|nr:MAG: hypothetical protein L6W00_27680 [Lentisphaeria bacterium]